MQRQQAVVTLFIICLYFVLLPDYQITGLVLLCKSSSDRRVNDQCVSELVAVFPVLIQLPARRRSSCFRHLRIIIFFNGI